MRDSVNDLMGMIGDLASQQAETDQRFNTLLLEARSDRQLNRREHQEFREFMRDTLQEIRRIWQRSTG